MSNAQVKYIYQHKMECSISLFTYRSSFLNKKRFKVANKKLTAAWKKGKEFYTYICFYLLIEAISGYFCAQTYCVCKITKNRERKILHWRYKYVRSLREFDPILHKAKFRELSLFCSRQNIVIPCPPSNTS